jgi:hypothetical protein
MLSKPDFAALNGGLVPVFNDILAIERFGTLSVLKISSP